ncbi:MAG: hypothetical protein J0J04_04905 [Microbacterium sp.]|uniref:hypothetical protein n=1 Tax=Microbacterium sp. TaxID=51671 RepID=UPI001AC2B2A6|nr:hypothetical protein [Microbacterium sp.]MBN9214147.1 hypothetical protein [Microbacterium sp.]
MALHQLDTTLRPGDTIYGFAGGLFGRDSYDDKTIVRIDVAHGVAYAVLHCEADGQLYFLNGADKLRDAEEHTVRPIREW